MYWTGLSWHHRSGCKGVNLGYPNRKFLAKSKYYQEMPQLQINPPHLDEETQNNNNHTKAILNHYVAAMAATMLPEM